MEDYVTLMIGAPADIEKAKGQLKNIPYKVLSIPHNFKDVKLTVPALFEFMARSRLNLIQEDK
ncbi:MAG: hypothetical protein IJS15_08130 [Victivallales bacterium]|nr:hypothetical protein [Victivallales bacterium]